MTAPSESVFDENGHVELDSADTMYAALKELYLANPPKWRGHVYAGPTDNNPEWRLELNPDPDRKDRPGFTAEIGDHLQKVQPFGIVLKLTAEEYAESQGGN